MLLPYVPEGISVMVQTMHGGEDQLVYGNAAVLAAYSYAVLLGVRTHTPHPAATASQG